MHLFPEHDWKPWKFSLIVTKVFKNNKYQQNFQREFIEDLGAKLGFTKLEDYYQLGQRVLYLGNRVT